MDEWMNGLLVGWLVSLHHNIVYFICATHKTTLHTIYIVVVVVDFVLCIRECSQSSVGININITIVIVIVTNICCRSQSYFLCPSLIKWIELCSGDRWQWLCVAYTSIALHPFCWLLSNSIQFNSIRSHSLHTLTVSR